MQQELKLERITPGTMRWDPQPDISTYELALALPILLIAERPNRAHTAANMLSNLPATVRRHFYYRLEP